LIPIDAYVEALVLVTCKRPVAPRVPSQLDQLLGEPRNDLGGWIARSDDALSLGRRICEIKASTFAFICSVPPEFDLAWKFEGHLGQCEEIRRLRRSRVSIPVILTHHNSFSARPIGKRHIAQAHTSRSPERAERLRFT
jgi:hypothetical protein